MRHRPPPSPRQIAVDANQAIDRGQARVFRFLWLFLPEPSIARSLRFQYVMAARFVSEASNATLTYGSVIAVVAAGGSAFEAAITGTARLIPPALLGPLGGYLADALPKRASLLIGYAAKATLCFVVPLWMGTDLAGVFTLLLLVNIVGQLTGPAESALLPLVATSEQVPSATSMLSLVATLGSSFGMVVLAPVLVVLFGVRAVIAVTGILYILASTRVASFALGDVLSHINWSDLRGQLRWGPALSWLGDHPAVGSLILAGAIADSASVALQTLSPRYVSEVLGVSPERSVYVFAPSALGGLLALWLAPPAIRFLGERITTLTGVALVGLALVSLGAIQMANVTLDGVNPIRLLEYVGIGISTSLRTASFLAIFVGLGLTLAGSAVSVYINRRVPIGYQGRAFAIQSALKNAVSILPLLVLGAVASVVSIQLVVFLIPAFLVAASYALIALSYRLRGRQVPPRGEVLATFWEEPKPASE